MYITIAQLKADIGEDRYTQLVMGMADADVTAIITNKSKYIDDFISVAVPLPLEAANAVIESICYTLCRYTLWTRKQASDIPEHIRKEYEGALKLLTEIQKGSLKLGVTVAESDVTADLSWQASPRYFNPSGGTVGSDV